MNTTSFRGALRATVTALAAATVLTVVTPATAGAASTTQVAPARAAVAGQVSSAVTAVAVQARAAAAAAVPSGFVKHTSTYWTWFGPRSWIASYGAYGITVSSPTGSATWDYGASSTLCVRASSWPASASAFFAQRRAQLKAGARASKWTYTSITGVQTIGVRSYRQIAYFNATVGGKSLRGRVQFIYSDNGGGYCYQSSDARVSLKSIFTKTLPTLNNIAAFTTYRGPGVCNPTLFDPRRC